MPIRKKTPGKAEAELCPKIPSDDREFNMGAIKGSFLKEAGPVAAVVASISTGYFYAIANHADPLWSTIGATILILAFHIEPFLKKLSQRN
jgi:hypothetical protein